MGASPIPTFGTWQYQVPALSKLFIGEQTVRTGPVPIRVLAPSAVSAYQSIRLHYNVLIGFLTDGGVPYFTGTSPHPLMLFLLLDQMEQRDDRGKE